ncbi:hypothetical protein [Streptomyces sp. NPDC014656]
MHDLSPLHRRAGQLPEDHLKLLAGLAATRSRATEPTDRLG